MLKEEDLSHNFLLEANLGNEIAMTVLDVLGDFVRERQFKVWSMIYLTYSHYSYSKSMP